ncbi:MAG: carboxypeptidase regulatory-like domain-containing protein [Myxococcaceae bacterium]
MKKTLNSSGVAFLLVTLLSAQVAYAVGDQTGRLRGTIIDAATKTTLPGVEVKISSPSLIGGVQTRFTSDDGSFEFDKLPAGEYALEASYEATKPMKRATQVQLGQTTVLNLDWNPEFEGSETVVVEGKPAMNVDSTQSGNVLTSGSQGKIASRRTYQDVAQQVAGVSGGGNPNVRGGSAIMNRYLIDGLDVTDPVTNTFSSNINFDSIAAIQVLTGGMEAEHNSLGGVINLTSTQGGNDFRVDASFYANHPALSSRNSFGATANEGYKPFNTVPLTPAYTYLGNISVGGPIIRDHLWFNLGIQYSNNQAVQPPAPPLNVQAPPRVFQGIMPRAKLIFAPSSKHRFSLSGLADPATIDYLDNATTSANLRTALASRRQNQGGFLTVGRWDWFMTDTASTMVQVGYQQSSINTGPQGYFGKIDQDVVAQQYSDPDITYDFNRPYRINQDDGTVWYNNNVLSLDNRTTISAEGAFDYRFNALGTHEASIGLQSRIITQRRHLELPGGAFYEDRQGGSGEAGLCNTETGKGCYAEYTAEPFDNVNRGWTGGFYVKDRWRPLPFVTINPGIRFDYGTSKDGLGRKVSDMFAVGPRLGAIWDISKKQETLVYAYYGRSTEMLSLLAASNANSILINTNEWNQATKRYEFVGREGGPDGVILDPKNTRAPSADTIQVGLRQAVGKSTVLGVEYVFKKLSNVWDEVETNQLWDPSGTRVVGYRNGRPEQIKLITTPDSNTNTYQGVDFTVTGNPTPNIQLYGAYTLSWKYGPGSDSFGQLANRNQFYNPRQSQFFSGYSFGDIRHMVKASGSFALGPVTVGPNLVWQSGEIVDAVTYAVSDPRAGDIVRSPIGTQPGRLPHSQPNDQNTITEFRSPDFFNIDLRVVYDMHHLLGAHLQIIGDAFNVLNLGQATSYRNVGERANFGTIATRQQPFRLQLGLRFLYE